MLKRIALLSFVIANFLMIITALLFAASRLHKMVQRLKRKKHSREIDEQREEYKPPRTVHKLYTFYGTTDSVAGKYRELQRSYPTAYLHFEFHVVPSMNEWPNLLMVCRIECSDEEEAFKDRGLY